MARWAPHTTTTRELVDPAPVGTLWHRAALPRWPTSTELGPDGHPARGAFLPPVDLHQEGTSHA